MILSFQACSLGLLFIQFFFGYDDIPPKNDPKMTKVANETRKSLFTKTIAQFHYLVKIVHKSTYIVYPLSTPYVWSFYVSVTSMHLIQDKKSKQSKDQSKHILSWLSWLIYSCDFFHADFLYTYLCMYINLLSEYVINIYSCFDDFLLC